MSHKSEMAGPFHRGDTIINKHFTFYFYITYIQLTRHINSRRKKSNSFSNSEINFNGRIMSTLQEIADGWAKHVETLYDRHEGSFDRELKCHISREMQNINEWLFDEYSLAECPIITTEEVQAATA